LKKKPKRKNRKTQGKTQNLKEKNLKVLENFDNQVTKYLSNGHKNPLFLICKKQLKTQVKTQTINQKILKTQAKNLKNSRFRQIHLVELPKTGPN